MKKWFYLIAILMLLCLVACGSLDKTKDLESTGPSIIDYSLKQDLTQSMTDEIISAWDHMTSSPDNTYHLRGDIVYYGTINEYMVLQAPITEGGIFAGTYGYRRFENDGPMQIFLYGKGSDAEKSFFPLAYAISKGLVANLDEIHSQHFLFCEKELGYDYNFENEDLSENIKTAIQQEYLKNYLVEKSWDFRNGLSYYGKHNGYYIVIADSIEKMSQYNTFGEFEFPNSDTFLMLKYSESGALSLLTDEDYKEGIVTDETIQQIYETYQKYELSEYRKLLSKTFEPNNLMANEGYTTSITDYSSNKDLTDEVESTVSDAWNRFVADRGMQYRLRDELIYYGAFNGYIVVQAPLTSGGYDGTLGVREVESDGPVEIFVYSLTSGGNNEFLTFSYAYTNGVIQSEVVRAINERHFSYCEEVLGLTYTMKNEPLPPENTRLEIDSDLALSSEHNQGLKWGFDEDIIYFGKYNGYEIIFAENNSDGAAAVNFRVGEYSFELENRYNAYGYKEGVLYPLIDLIGQGEIDDQSVRQMQYITCIYNMHSHRLDLNE